MAIYKVIRKIVNGVKVTERHKLSSREVKAETMKYRGWDKVTYQKQYDLFKNKLRAFENFQKAHGIEKEAQSPAELLYKQAKTMAREGANYKPTIAMQRIMSFSAVSIPKGEALAKNFDSVYSQRRMATFEKATNSAFKEFIKQIPKAKEIVEKIADPVKREDALAKLADHIHTKMSDDDEAIPEGEMYGSDNVGNDFDYSYWL